MPDHKKKKQIYENHSFFSLKLWTRFWSILSEQGNKYIRENKINNQEINGLY